MEVESSDNDSYIPSSCSDSTSTEQETSLDEIELISRNEPRDGEGWSLMADPFEDGEDNSQFVLRRKFGDSNFDQNICNKNSISNKLSALKLFLDNDVMKNIVNYTNTRAETYIKQRKSDIDAGKITKLGKRVKKDKDNVLGLKWRPIDLNTLWTFFALLMIMTAWKAPSIKDYWAVDLLSGSLVFTAQIMSKNRFLQILKFLRFCNPNNYRPNQLNTRVEEFFNAMIKKSMELCDPGDNLSIDESIAPFMGRIRIKQYIQNKRHRFGLKLFMLCPSSPSLLGYTSNFVLYVGEETYTFGQHVDDDLRNNEDISKTERIVFKLLTSSHHNMLNEGRHIATDNWYTSVHLAELLYNYKTYTTGTIRPNRGVPKILQNVQLKVPQTAFAKRDKILIAKYKPKQKKIVHVLSTKYCAGKFVEKKTYKKGGESFFHKKNNVVDKYNKTMGGVDMTDQVLSHYDIARKSMTWFKKLSLHILSLVTLNSKIIYYDVNPVPKKKKSTFPQYLSELAKEILLNHSKGYRTLNTELLSPMKKNKSKNPLLIMQSSKGIKRKRSIYTTCDVGIQVDSPALDDTPAQDLQTPSTSAGVTTTGAKRSRPDTPSTSTEATTNLVAGPSSLPFEITNYESIVDCKVHQLVKLVRTKKKKMCKLCYQKEEKRLMVSTYCFTCNNEPGLHPRCMNDYHATLGN